jgi:hypothetical protein
VKVALAAVTIVPRHFEIKKIKIIRNWTYFAFPKLAMILIKRKNWSYFAFPKLAMILIKRKIWSYFAFPKLAMILIKR